MIQLSKVGPSSSEHVVILIYLWLEEYRKTIDVDGELTWVSAFFALAAKLLRVIIPYWVPDVFMSTLPLTFSEYSSRSSIRLEQSNLQPSMSYILQLVGASSSFSGKPIISVVAWIPPDANILPVFSLTLEASLREVTSLRQQILRIKGENSVRCLSVIHITPRLT